MDLTISGTSLNMNSTINIPDTSQQGRSVAEIIVKATALTAASTIAAGHLTTLRRQPIGLASYQVLATILIPGFPIAELAISICRTLKTCGREGLRPGVRYYVSATLDQRAICILGSDTEESIPLNFVPHHTAEVERGDYDIRWTARLFTLAVFLMQSLLCMWLWTRRVQHRGRNYLDDYTALTAISGLTIALVSISITLLNSTWRTHECYVSKFKNRFIEPSAPDLFDQLMRRTNLLEVQVANILASIFRSCGLLTIKASSLIDSAIYLQEIQCLDWPLRRTRTKLFSRFPPILCEEECQIPDPVALIHCDASCHLKTFSCPSGNLYDDLIACFGLLGRIITYVAACYPAILVASALLWLLCQRVRSLKQGSGRVMGRLLESCGKWYLASSFGLLVLTAYDLTDFRDWEGWMWRDPWAERFWTF